MPRRTHPRERAKHSREYTRYQRERYVAKRWGYLKRHYGFGWMRTVHPEMVREVEDARREAVAGYERFNSEIAWSGDWGEGQFDYPESYRVLDVIGWEGQDVGWGDWPFDIARGSLAVKMPMAHRRGRRKCPACAWKADAHRRYSERGAPQIEEWT